MPKWRASACGPASREGALTYTIFSPCIDTKNKSCVDVCPVSCIYLESDELDRMLYINPDECIECGACEPECPVVAIAHDSAVPAEEQEFTALNAQWFEDPDAVRARIEQIKPSA